MKTVARVSFGMLRASCNGVEMDIRNLRGSNTYRFPVQDTLSLKVGQKLVAKVLEVEPKHANLEIMGHVVSTQTPEEVKPGEQLLLMYKGMENRTMTFKALAKEEGTNDGPSLEASSLCSKLGLSANPQRLQIIKGLLSFRLPLTSAFVQNTERILRAFDEESVPQRLEQVLVLAKLGVTATKEMLSSIPTITSSGTLRLATEFPELFEIKEEAAQPKVEQRLVRLEDQKPVMDASWKEGTQKSEVPLSQGSPPLSSLSNAESSPKQSLPKGAQETIPQGANQTLVPPIKLEGPSMDRSFLVDKEQIVLLPQGEPFLKGSEEEAELSQDLKGERGRLSGEETRQDPVREGVKAKSDAPILRSKEARTNVREGDKEVLQKESLENIPRPVSLSAAAQSMLQAKEAKTMSFEFLGLLNEAVGEVLRNMALQETGTNQYHLVFPFLFNEAEYMAQLRVGEEGGRSKEEKQKGFRGQLAVSTHYLGKVYVDFLFQEKSLTLVVSALEEGVAAIRENLSLLSNQLRKQGFSVTTQVVTGSGRDHERRWTEMSLALNEVNQKTIKSIDISG